MLADLGIARHPRGTVVFSTVRAPGMGTRTYSAPEQLRDGRDATAAADLYAVAATCVHLILGRPVPDLFRAEADPRALNGLPEAWRPVFTKALAYDAEARHSDAHAMALAWAQAEGRPLPPELPWPSGGLWTRVRGWLGRS